ncbi:hypothetical protein Leryth_024036 [Lithospermum erythrorhizon]|nr:hypothetical protein Leryth_024036 [Lithospermum erythrorhizon]
MQCPLWPYEEASERTSQSSSSKSTTIDSKISPQYEFITATSSSVQPNTQFTNHESLSSLSESFSYFKKAYPNYSKTTLADTIRLQEYYHLSASNRVCLDYIGHGLFTSYSRPPDHASASSSSSTTINLFQDLSVPEQPLFNIAFKNVILSSQLMHSVKESEFECSMKQRITKFMNICEDDYSMVFTANLSSAFRLLADSYPFQTNPNLVTLYDFENEAVEAMNKSAKTKGGRAMSAEFSWPNLRIQSRKLRKMIVRKRRKNGRGLFVFPLQSRMTGTRYSYLWMSLARENGWHILLDASGLGADASGLGAKDMETLGLSLFQPDFIICSFFKVFGENPSGFSCLFVKKSCISILDKSSTNMGIVSLVPISSPFEDISSTDEESLRLMQKSITDPGPSTPLKMKEDKQLKSLNEIQQSDESVEENLIKCKGLDHADTLGLVLISNRQRYLINWLINALMNLRHPYSGNEHHLVRIYGPKVKFDRGPAVAFSVYDWKGEKVDPLLVQKLADRNNISLGCGFLQHIDFSDNYEEEKKNILELRGKKGDSAASIGISVVTAFLGFLTNFEDMYRLWAFVSRFLDADYVEKERWRYKALNQSTVEL